MPREFIGSAAGNFRSGRPPGFMPEAIVIHRTGGSRHALRTRFGDPASSLSAHYLVCRDGRVEQYVLETDTAFHAGLVVNPTWPLLRAKANPNFYTIGVELEGARDDDWPDAQIAATAALLAGVADRWHIPLDADHVVPHSAIRASTGCPAATCPIALILATAAEALALAPSPSTDAMELATLPAAPPAGAAGAGVPINRTTFVLAAKEFFAEVIPKDLVVLHFTAGNTARSAFDTWRNDPQHIGTAYIVDVDGTIYEVFPPSAWAAHLGVKGTKNVHDRRSIGIEIANVGPLQRSSDDPSVLNWWPRRSANAPDFTTKFCRLDETHRYVAAEYRGKSHFASFPDVQVDAAGALVRRLCDEFSIAATLPPLARRFTSDLNAFASYQGVCTHANFRQDKWDIGPAFPWDRLGL